MSRQEYFKINLCVLISGLTAFVSAPTAAATVSWSGTGSNDMENAANWSPGSVPGLADTAVFNSTLSGINLTPADQNLIFDVSAFHFANAASPFTISIENQPLTFTGAGITGANTNATLNVTNSNNSGFPGSLLSFSSGSATSGAANINITNTGALSGSLSSTSTGSINAQLFANSDFSMSNGGTLTLSNTGTDSTTGTGNNGVANTGSSQVQAGGTFNAGSNVAITVSNSGAFSGNNSVQGDAIAIVNGGQFDAAGAFQAGNNLNFSAANSGTDSSTGVGLSDIGQTNAAQVLFQTTATLGNNATFHVSNLGTTSSDTTSFPDFVGYVNDQQLFVGNAFQAGNGPPVSR